MSGHTIVVQPDHGIEPVVALLRSAVATVLIEQFTFTHPVLLDEVLALHDRGARVRVLLNGAKATGERLNDPYFATFLVAACTLLFRKTRTNPIPVLAVAGLFGWLRLV